MLATPEITQKQLLTSRWFPLRPHEKQSALYRCQDLLVAVRAGRGSGKTEIAKRKLVRSLPLGDGKYAYCGPVREQAKRVAWDDLISLINPRWLAEPPSLTELRVKTIWGSELYVVGMDKPQRIEGTQWSGIVVDESADIKPGAVDRSILPALSWRNGWCWRIGVPKRYGVGAREFHQICDNPDKGYTFFGWSSETLLSPKQIAHLRSTLDEKDFREQIQGEAVASGGGAFYNFDIGENVQSGDITEYDPRRTIIVGTDFNVDPMAWCLCHVVAGKLIVFDEIWLRSTTTKQALDYLWLRYGDHKSGWLFIGDATGQARKTSASNASPSDYLIIKQDNRFEGAQVRFPASNPPIKDRLASCCALLCNSADERRVFISPQCRQLINDLQYRQIDSTGKPADASMDMGHISDAFGYVVHSLFPINLNAAMADAENDTAGEITIFNGR